MAVVKPFMCIRPAADKRPGWRPCPMMCITERKPASGVKGNPLSFLNIDRAETQFGDDVDTYDSRVYDKAGSCLIVRLRKGSM